MNARAKNLIAQLHGRCPPGIIRCLGALPQRVAPAATYLLLLRLLDERAASQVLWHSTKITSNLLHLLDRLDPPLRRTKFVSFVGTLRGADGVDCLIALLTRHCPNVNRQDLLESLALVETTQSLERWFTRWLMHAPLPEPPWEGTSLLRPLRTIKEIEAVAEQFDNCLVRKVTQVLNHDSYYYEWVGRRGGAIAEITRSLLGWTVKEIKGPSNATVPARTFNKIIVTFAEAGIIHALRFSRLPHHVDPWWFKEMVEFDQDWLKT
jgi:hypothetical protein